MEVPMRDYQRELVYRWENTLPTGKSLPFELIKPYVHKVWHDMGLKYPPLVQPLPKNTTTKLGDANRNVVRFPVNGATEQTILHELAHSMTTHTDGIGHQHNGVFVGVYMTLMEKYLNVPALLMFASAKAHGVNFEPFAKPRITDDHHLYVG